MTKWKGHFRPWRRLLWQKYWTRRNIRADSTTEALETNETLLITIKIYSYIATLDFGAPGADVYRTGNQTLCQNWWWTQVLSKIDVNRFGCHVADRTWVCFRIHLSPCPHCATNCNIGANLTEIFWRGRPLTWSEGLFWLWEMEIWLFVDVEISLHTQNPHDSDDEGGEKWGTVENGLFWL